jgi:hypothetical protein
MFAKERGGKRAMSKLVAAALVSVASLSTAVMNWMFGQSPMLGLVAGGIAGGRLLVSIIE